MARTVAASTGARIRPEATSVAAGKASNFPKTFIRVQVSSLFLRNISCVITNKKINIRKRLFCKKCLFVCFQFEDINECKDTPCQEDEICVNSYGGHSCIPGELFSFYLCSLICHEPTR